MNRGPWFVKGPFCEARELALYNFYFRTQESQFSCGSSNLQSPHSQLFLRCNPDLPSVVTSHPVILRNHSELWHLADANFSRVEAPWMKPAP